MFLKNKIFISLTLLLILTFNLSSIANDFTNTPSKPLFVIVSADFCFACKQIEPIIEELKKQYADQVTFVNLDLSSEKTLYLSQQLAQSYGLSDYFNKNRSQIPVVGLFCSGYSEPTKQIIGSNSKESYENSISELLSTPNICNNNVNQKDPYYPSYNPPNLQLANKPSNNFKNKAFNNTTKDLKKYGTSVKNEAVRAATNYIRIKEVTLLQSLFNR